MEAVQKVTQRLKYLDAAKGWGICMVVFGHITSLGNPVDVWFSSYKLTIFYIVSGYLLCMRQTLQKYSFKTYIVKQIEGLLVPYLGYSSIVLLYHICVGLMKGTESSAILNKFLEQLYATLSFRGVSALWFLPSLFIGQVVFFLAVKARKAVRFIILLGALAVAQGTTVLLPWLDDRYSGARYKIVSFPVLTVSKGLLAVIFIGIGYIGYLLIKNLQNRNYRFLLGLVLFLGSIWLSQQNKGVDVNMMRLGANPLLFYIGGFAGSFGTVLILEFLEKYWKMTFLNFCGQHSLIIMATHGTLGFKSLCIAGWKAMYTLSEEAGLRYYLESTGILLELMLMECGVVTVVEKYFPRLAGKRGKKWRQS